MNTRMNKVKVVCSMELETIQYIIVDLLLITTQHTIYVSIVYNKYSSNIIRSFFKMIEPQKKFCNLSVSEIYL